MTEDIVSELRDEQVRFVFQGGSTYALTLADEIEGLRMEIAHLLAEKGRSKCWSMWMQPD